MTLTMNIYDQIASKIEDSYRFQVMGQVNLLVNSVGSVFGYLLLGKIPKDVIEILEWVGNQEIFDKDTLNKRKLIDEDALNELKLNVYQQACPEIYWKASQEILEKMKLSRSRKSSPVDLRNIDKRDYRIRLLKKLKKLVSPQSLSIPVGKDWVRSRGKRDDLSKKNYPIVRHGMAVLYNLLFPFYPKPQLRTFGKRKETGSQRYSTELAGDIVTLFKTEFVFKTESGSLFKPLNDLEERDVFSAIEWVNKSGNKK